MKQNIETLLRSVGFKIQNTYGGFNKTPHSEQSHQIVFVCRKP